MIFAAGSTQVVYSTNESNKVALKIIAGAAGSMTDALQLHNHKLGETSCAPPPLSSPMLVCSLLVPALQPPWC
jgi:hypothetical protein